MDKLLGWKIEKTITDQLFYAHAMFSERGYVYKSDMQ